MGRRDFGNVLNVPERRGWYVRFTWRGQRIWRSGGPTAAIARGKLSRLRTLLESGKELDVALHDIFGDRIAKGMSFKEAVPAYMDYAEPRKKPSTFASDRYRFRMLNGGSWSGKRLTDIQPEHLTRWCEERRKSGTSGITVNHDLNLGSALFQWAILMGYATVNPFRRVPRYSSKGREREVYLSPEESRALVAAASTTMRPVLLLALSTGMRRGEIVSLKWGAVDLDRRELVITSDLAKSGRTRVVPMTDDLHRELAALRNAMKVRAISGTDAVFARKNGRRNGKPISVGVLRHGMEKALEGCDAIPEEKRAKLNFHSLRHTAASLMAAAGVPIFDISKILGHSSLTVTLRYAHFSPESGRSAIEKLGQKLGFSGMA